MPPRILRLVLPTCAVGLLIAGCSSDTPAPRRSTADAPTQCSGGAAPRAGGPATAYDAPVATTDHPALATQVGAPAMTSVPAKAGYRVASVHVSARIVRNGSYPLSPASLVLQDSRGRVCPRPARNQLPRALTLGTVDETHAADGNVAFLVPADADLADYTVLYVANPGDRAALARWSRKGQAPRSTVGNTCDGPAGKPSRAGMRADRFGRPVSRVIDGVGTTVTAQPPSTRPLAASDRVPADVDGVAVSIKVVATGADAYVDRRSFVLLDGAGHTCRYGSVPSPGETLTSALIKSGSSGAYTLIFWVPKGSSVRSWTLLQLGAPGSSAAVASWSSPSAASSS